VENFEEVAKISLHTKQINAIKLVANHEIWVCSDDKSITIVTLTKDKQRLELVNTNHTLLTSSSPSIYSTKRNNFIITFE